MIFTVWVDIHVTGVWKVLGWYLLLEQAEPIEDFCNISQSFQKFSRIVAKII
jgi:hypothetical protein